MNREQAYDKCLTKLTWATEQLQINAKPSQLAAIADLIVQPMTGPWRYFHTPQHIFEVGGEEDPLEVLAALFHDVVYVQVDRSINFNLSYYIAPFSKEAKGQLQIRDREELPKDWCFEMTVAVFGFSPSQPLNPFAGQNEFLSALVAIKALEGLLTREQLLQVVACIEATIPFRQKTPEGLTASEILHQRLQKISRQLNLQLGEDDILEAVKKSVRVANRDVISFSHPSAAHFLDNTWNLLPETNHNLIGSSSYTVREYRLAVQKMEGFISRLEPKVVFRQFRDEPDDETFHCWQLGAKRNIETAKLYLGCKLFAIALLEALSLRLGWEIPLATLMGELPTKNSEAFHLEDFLPEIIDAHRPQTEIDWDVFYLLEKGRNKTSQYDLKNSPLSTFIIKSIGFEEMRHQCDRAKAFFEGKISPEDLIAGCDPKVTEVIVEAVVKLFESRKAAIRRYF